MAGEEQSAFKIFSIYITHKFSDHNPRSQNTGAMRAGI